MPRKKKVIEEEESEPKKDAPKPAPVVAPVVKPAEFIEPEKENPYYKKTLWHGVKEVWQCNKCGVFRESEDSMIVHVVIHVPRLEQSALLDELMKEYKK